MVCHAAAFYALRSAFTAPTTDTVRPAGLSPFQRSCFSPRRPVVRISPPSDFSFLLSQFLLSPKVPHDAHNSSSNLRVDPFPEGGKSQNRCGGLEAGLAQC
jgi:hypothetical protein